jgi:hypothetical protein
MQIQGLYIHLTLFSVFIVLVEKFSPAIPWEAFLDLYRRLTVHCPQRGSVGQQKPLVPRGNGTTLLLVPNADFVFIQASLAVCARGYAFQRLVLLSGSLRMV